MSDSKNMTIATMALLLASACVSVTMIAAKPTIAQDSRTQEQLEKLKFYLNETWTTDD